MEQFGIKFKMKDGSTDYYDPLKKDDFQETSDAFVLGMNYLYEIPKSEVESFKWYDICDDCGYELFEEGCRNCAEKEELKNL